MSFTPSIIFSTMKLPLVYHYFLPFFSLNLILWLALPAANALTNETDRLALLKFKESITIDPHGVLSSWNDSVHFCNWVGITCSRQHQRVTALQLDGSELHGLISPHIGNLSFLQHVFLRNNTLFGQIPEEISHLFRLKELLLQNNTLSGEIPPSLANCSKLTNLVLRQNKLTGTIPKEFGSLNKLQVLSVGINNLTGGLPSSLGNISSLKTLNARDNNLEGIIPDEIGHLKNLEVFVVSTNKLSNTIPSSLYNISSIWVILVAQNQLSGTLPNYIGSTTPNLQSLELLGNQLSGPIPASLSNISGLQTIDLGNNKFVGQVPTNMGSLQQLQILSIYDNDLGSNSSRDLDFLYSLANCSNLEYLQLGINNFGGVFPQSVGNLTTQLKELLFDETNIYGNIPMEIGNLINLDALTLQSNFLTGIIPVTIGKLGNLNLLALGLNRLSGQIPPIMGNLTQLIELHLLDNKLEGVIPPSIGNCQNLQYLDISGNVLTGAIPPQLIGLSSLTRLLNLSGNSLSGRLPQEVGNLKNLNTLDLSENGLSGEIPATIEYCTSLEQLLLQANAFQGGIPASMSALRGLSVLDLSQNNLSGIIPQDLQKLPSYIYLNLSFNNLQGEVPTGGLFQNASAISLTGNNLLCGGIHSLHLPSCPLSITKNEKHLISRLKIIVICVVLSFFILGTSLFALWWVRRPKRKATTFSAIEELPKISYGQLYHATGGFSSDNLIGSGSFGSVYKGHFDPEDRAVAVKVLNLRNKRASKSFMAECKALKSIRHRNLVKILTCCSSTDYKGGDFKALIFEFMENGSLDKWLHREDGGNGSLNLLQRLNIATDVASALDYLHHECEQPIIHCDLKPSNILLDSDMVAHVGDFGLARLLSVTKQVPQNQSSSIGLKGTVGYAAPEYGIGGEASKEGDVYSFGVLILEMFTGKRPVHEMFKDGFNLHHYVRSSLPQNLVHIVDPILIPTEAEETAESSYREEIGLEDENESMKQRQIQIDAELHQLLASLFDVGLACSLQSSKERTNMKDVCKELHLIESKYLSAD